jgi:hypothetical protein
VFNAIFSNISTISWRPVLVMEEAGVPGLKMALNTINQIKSNQISYPRREPNLQTVVLITTIT